MKTISKRVLMKHTPERAPLCGFVGYVDHHKPRLLRRIGWEIANDIHDDFSDQFSEDNGATWGELRPSLAKKRVEGGYICNTENAMLLLPDGRVMTFTNDKFEYDLAGCNLGTPCSARITVGTPEEIARGQGASFVSDFGLKQGVCFSFPQPIVDRRGRVLATVQWQKQDVDGSLRRRGFEGRVPGIATNTEPGQPLALRPDMPDVFVDYWEVGLLIGEPQGDGSFAWRRTGAPDHDFECSSRGMCEGALTELNDGTLVMVMRGSNAHYPDKPGYKWVTYSTDGGESWTKAAPLGCSDGSIIESAANGSMFFRSITDGRLYWVGNLCTEGRRPVGNNPRSPLHVVRMQEHPFAFERDTITVVDRTNVDAGEHPNTQHSNFKIYQDRQTGDLLIYLTRFGENGYDRDQWMRADLYEYRVSMA